MIEMKISKDKLKKESRQDNSLVLDKYYPSILNYINGTMASSQTGPTQVGKLSEIMQEYLNENPDIHSVDGWRNNYLSKKIVLNVKKEGTKNSKVKKEFTGKECIERAVRKNIELKDKLKEILDNLSNDIIRKYIENLMFDKTYSGLVIEKPIAHATFKKILKDKGQKFIETNARKSTSLEESQGIDFVYEGVDNITLQIKSNYSLIKAPMAKMSRSAKNYDYSASYDDVRELLVIERNGGE